MDKQPLYLSFATQKGGAGKSVFTILAASWLHYRMGFNVAVVDCDHPQNSVVGVRGRDIKRVASDDFYKAQAVAQFKNLQKKAYPVIGCDVQRALRWVENGSDDMIDAEIERAGYADNLDVVLFDMPGTVNQSELDVQTNKRKGVLTLIACMDYVFCPVKNDRSVIESSLMFVSEVQDKIITQNVGALKQIFMYWTEVDGRETTKLYDLMAAGAEQYGFSMMETRIPFLVRFKREITDTYDVFKCTLFPASQRLAKDGKIEQFMSEMCIKINLEKGL